MPGLNIASAIQEGLASKDERKLNALKMMGVEDAQRRNAMTEDVKTAEVLLKNKDTKGAMEFLSDRAQASSQSGGNPRETMEVYNTIRDGNVPEALDMLANYRSVFDDGYTDERQSSQAKTNYVNKVSPPQTDQETGQQYVIITDPNTETTRRVDVAGGKALTQDAKDTKLVRRSLLDDARKVSRESFEGLKTVRSGLGAYQDALTAIENNASSGKLQSFFPSFTEATINLENAGARLGLNVIQLCRH
jgi:hypothetical protein